jgi:hypothetical protein
LLRFPSSPCLIDRIAFRDILIITDSKYTKNTANKSEVLLQFVAQCIYGLAGLSCTEEKWQYREELA